jgi:hypothetical protein
VCSNCHRHGVSCFYEIAPRISSISTPAPPSQSTTPKSQQDLYPGHDLLSDYRGSIVQPLDLVDEFAQDKIYSMEFDDPAIFDVPESRSRRLLEHRLLQNYIERTSKTFAACHHEDVRIAWSCQVPKLALEHDNLLYQVLSISAMHLLKSTPNDLELINARQTYHCLALREHRKAVAELNIQNADAVCCASSLIFVDAFASLHGRPIEPYSPPMEWLHMARGAGSVFAVGIAALEDSKEFESSIIYGIANRGRYFDNDLQMFQETNRNGLTGLLAQGILEEPWDQETQRAYEKTLSYIGWVQLAIRENEHPMGICRRMMAFAILAPKRFIECVDQMRPRALVILAYFFALGAQLRDTWWIGETLQREIHAIERVVPPEWKPFMREPTSRIGLKAV